MGRRKTTAIADKFFEEKKVPSEDAASGLATQYTCLCCHAEPFLGLTGTKKVAHLLGMPGAGVVKCTQGKMKISKDDFEALAASTKGAREWKQRGAGGSHPYLSDSRLVIASHRVTSHIASHRTESHRTSHTIA